MLFYKGASAPYATIDLFTAMNGNEARTPLVQSGCSLLGKSDMLIPTVTFPGLPQLVTEHRALIQLGDTLDAIGRDGEKGRHLQSGRDVGNAHGHNKISGLRAPCI